MKNKLRFKGTLLILAFVGILSSCSTNDDTYEVDPEQIAGFMAINTVTDQQQIGVSLSGIYVGQPLPYRAYTGGYVNIFPGERSTDAFSPYSGNTLSSTSFTYEKGKYYSLFITGRKDHYENIIIEDNLNDLAVQDSISYVRYINAIPTEEVPELTLANATDTLLKEKAAYQEVSEFLKVKGKELTIQVNGDSIQAERTIELENRKIYTLLIVGNPESTDDLKKAQIRYIENGRLIEDPDEDKQQQSINLN